MELWVISQLRGFGVFHKTLPVAKSTAIINALLPGARMTLSPSMSGHCPAYHSGTVTPYSATRSLNQIWLPARSQHITWHLGPSVTTYLSVTAGTVRDIPW